MNDSAFEALMIGVNTFIFIIALTSGILLMGKINDLVEYTKKEVASNSNGALIENEGEIASRSFLGTEVYALYGQAKRGELESGVEIKVNLNGVKQKIEDYGGIGLVYLSDTFLLQITDENKFVFVLQ